MNTKEFLVSSLRNAWIEEPEFHLAAYLRKGQRFYQGKLVLTFELASITVDEEYRSQGYFKQYLLKLEELIPKQYFFYAENVLGKSDTKEFKIYFQKNSWIDISENSFAKECSPSFLKERTNGTLKS